MMIGAVGSFLATAPVLFSPLRRMRALPDGMPQDGAVDGEAVDDGSLEEKDRA
jgi:hypothetical protein